MMNKLLTFSVAAYNVEKYLDKLLKSITAAKRSDLIEVLVVNDGSKDRTAAIAKEYETKFPGIVRLVDKENGGHGSTINRGIKEATGKYFRAVDGDDWVDTDALNKIMENLGALEVDVVLMDYKICYEAGPTVVEKTASMESGRVYEFEDAIAKLDYMRYHAVIYRTEFLRENNISLDEHCFYVDTEYMLYAIPKIKTIVYYEYPLYCYRIGLGEQSVSNEGRRKHILDGKKVAASLQAFYKKHVATLSDARKNYIENGLASHCSFQFNSWMLFKANKEHRNELVAFDKMIRSEMPRVYEKMNSMSKTIVVLRKSNYLAYWPVQWVKQIKGA